MPQPGSFPAWEQLTIANDFVFCKAMLDEGLCAQVLEAVLGMRIDHVEHVARQHVLDTSPAAKSVRLDVYVHDGAGSVFDVEMQACQTPALARRTRFYHAQMASEQLDRGETYDRLPDAYVIFLCNFDPFGKGRRVYSFENRCVEERGLALDDGARTVFLSATSPKDARYPEQLNDLLDYVSGAEAAGELSARVDRRVREVILNAEWRREYMLLEWRDRENVQKGIQIGREEGREEGANQLGELISALLAQGRVDDAARAASDPQARKQLAEELGLTTADKQAVEEFGLPPVELVAQ